MNTLIAIAKYLIALVIDLAPSTDKAIKGISKALDQLDAVVAHQTAVAAKHDDSISSLVAQQQAANEAADRAAKIAKRFAKLVA